MRAVVITEPGGPEVLPMSQVAQAHLAMAASEHIGKIVLVRE